MISIFNNERKHHEATESNWWRRSEEAANQGNGANAEEDQEMNRLRTRIALLALFFATAKAFDFAIVHRPYGEFWDMVYFAGAASVDWLMFKACHRFISGKLCRDIEALCIASIVTNALGFALYMAEFPPSIYNWTIAGINYVLLARLIFLGGSDVFNNHHWCDLVRGLAGGRTYRTKEKA